MANLLTMFSEPWRWSTPKPAGRVDPGDDIFEVQAPVPSETSDELMLAATSPNGAPLPALGRPDVRYFADVTYWDDSPFVYARCFRAGAV